MQDFIAAAGIRTGSGALPNKSTLVSCQIKDFLSLLYRIDCLGNHLKYLAWITDHPAGNSQTGLYISHNRGILHLLIDKKIGNFHGHLTLHAPG